MAHPSRKCGGRVGTQGARVNGAQARPGGCFNLHPKNNDSLLLSFKQEVELIRFAFWKDYSGQIGGDCCDLCGNQWSLDKDVRC